MSNVKCQIIKAKPSAKIFINELVGIPNRKEIEEVIGKTLRIERKENISLSITFVGDNFIKRLNKKYRFRDKATDVLSFPLGEKNVLGDIFISVPTARKNAKLFDQSLREELERLVVHGILHLLSYKHKTLREKKRMQARENRILSW
jgi:probable rRNA maturation factor